MGNVNVKRKKDFQRARQHRMSVLAPLEGVEVVFFDLDDTLYQNDFATFQKIADATELYSSEKLGLSQEEALKLETKYGTIVKGLLEEGYITDDKLDEYLGTIYDIPLDDVVPTPELRKVVGGVTKRRLLFTTSIKEHADRVMDVLGISDLFEGCIDARQCDFQSKATEECFRKAMEIAGVESAEQCLVIDNSVKNIQVAKQMGFRTVVCGVKDRHGKDKPLVADYTIESIKELPAVCPGLYSETFATPKKEDDFAISTMTQIESRMTANPGSKIHVFFLLGGPGSGKGTLSGKLVSSSLSMVPISAGDVLRNVRNDPDNPHSKLINGHVEAGTLVPGDITMQLLYEEMQASEHATFVLDGFPRSMENYTSWKSHELLSQHATVEGIIHLECPEDEIRRRLAKRGRADDTPEVIQKRINSYTNETIPVIDHLVNVEGMAIWNINSNREVQVIADEVHQLLTENFLEII